MRLTDLIPSFIVMLRGSSASLLILMAIGAPALAGDSNNYGGGGGGNYHGGGGSIGEGTPPITSAPEIDLASLPGALMLLAGGTMVVTERLRRK